MQVHVDRPTKKRLGVDMKSDTYGYAQAFTDRHLGPRDLEIDEMLRQLKLESLDQLIDHVVPKNIRSNEPLHIGEGWSEKRFLTDLKVMASKNKVCKQYIGMGFNECVTPPVIQRHVLENPQWYTAYTPYQAEIAQGRLEALLNFQTMITDLTGMEVSNASLLDEGTAAAEAMSFCRNILTKHKGTKFFVSQNCHPHVLDVLKTRSEPIGIELVIGDETQFDFADDFFASLISYPDTYGNISEIESYIEKAHKAGQMVAVDADLLSLTLLKSPGELGADVVIGNSQRFGVPLGNGGPHAAFFAAKEKHKRLVPGRIVGVSKDSSGRKAYRLALQTREQHIRRERATSNICTSQVLLANMASFYAVYHGPQGLKEIATDIHKKAVVVRELLLANDIQVLSENFFDTLNIISGSEVLTRAEAQAINLRQIDQQTIGLSIGEGCELNDLQQLLACFGVTATADELNSRLNAAELRIPSELLRTSEYLTHSIFHCYRSETELLRYIWKLQERDLTLAQAMIPLGSCTMKLNAAAELMPVTWPEFNSIHPFAPIQQMSGYLEMIKDLEQDLADITGFTAVSLQPNAGSQGEYAGLLVIKKYHESQGQSARNICLIPSSAHGTNPASASMTGMKVVVVKCDEQGNIDVEDLKQKSELHKDMLAALMITYPSTHGVFEETIKEICNIIHDNGGQVYMDGANMNALVGICRPQEFGADVAHLNLHKTFAIPHGGGGPGVGPIGVAAHLAKFLPKHSLVPECGPENGISAVASAPWGSASILPISYGYIKMMGSDGLKKATQVAILNANYMANRLKDHFPILYTGKNGWVAHECIVDVRGLKDTAGITVDDIAKRLVDYGFHAPTMSWPVAGTLMIEPTESESTDELDRFCDALISIKAECAKIQSGEWKADNNPVVNAPHPAADVTSDSWNFPYTRKEAAYPMKSQEQQKYWPPVSRIDNVYGDKNLICSCPPLSDYED